MDKGDRERALIVPSLCSGWAEIKSRKSVKEEISGKFNYIFYVFKVFST